MIFHGTLVMGLRARSYCSNMACYVQEKWSAHPLEGDGEHDRRYET